MTLSADAVLSAAMALSPAERAVLAQKLLESLWETDRTAVETALADELERRVRKMAQAKAKKKSKRPGSE